MRNLRILKQSIVNRCKIIKITDLFCVDRVVGHHVKMAFLNLQNRK